MIPVEEIAKKEFCKLSSLDSVGLAVKTIKEKNVDCLLVEEEGELKGVVTSRQLFGYPSSRLIVDCAIEPIATIPEGILADEALKVLEEKKVGLLVLLNNKELPIGILTREVIISSLFQEVKRLWKEKEEDITERKRAEEGLKERLEDLETFHKVAVGRELKMQKMEEEIEKLRKERETR